MSGCFPAFHHTGRRSVPGDWPRNPPRTFLFPGGCDSQPPVVVGFIMPLAGFGQRPLQRTAVERSSRICAWAITALDSVPPIDGGWNSCISRLSLGLDHGDDRADLVHREVL